LLRWFITTILRDKRISLKRKNDTMLLIWPALMAFADFLALAGSMILAYQVRFHAEWFTEIVPVIYGVPPLRVYVVSAVVASAFMVLFMAMRRVYRLQLGRTPLREAWQATISFLFGFALLVAMLFFYREFFYSRIVALLTLFLGVVFLTVLRFAMAAIRRIFAKGGPFYSALLVGSSADGALQRLQRVGDSGINVQQTMPDGGSLDLDRLCETAGSGNIDTVLLAYRFDQYSRVREIIETLQGLRLNFLLLPDPDALDTGMLRSVQLAGIPMLQLREDPLAGWNGLIKGTFDIAVSALLLVLLSPLFLLAGLLVKLSSSGPVFYRQQRVGLDGRPFQMIKFRSMRVDAEKGSGPVWASPDDPRTTPVGKFLRRWSIDELPQLWNVLRRDMSLVGPRPERPAFVEKFSREVPRYRERHRLRSGMTGLAQVNGLRGQASIEERTRYDLLYIENWSLGLDIWILARTISAVLFGRDAY
jgi:exopolysaccharide biosynthesis polyprenyl glycosylphosphotransferase